MRDDDIGRWLKSNSWILLAFFCGVGLWVMAPLSDRLGEDSVSVPVFGAAGTEEQSLKSLETAKNPQGAPGTALSEGDAQNLLGGEAPNTPSSLPDGSQGEPLQASASGEGSGSETLAAALNKAGESGKDKEEGRGGWGHQSVHTGFSAPKAKFSQLPSRGSASSGASMAAAGAFFGLGGNPGLVESRAPDLSAPKIRGSLIRRAGGVVESLQGVEKAAKESLRGDGERAAGSGQRSFDAAGAKGRSLAGGAAGGGVGLGEGQDVPANLKSNEGLDLQHKDIQPPAVTEAKEYKSKKDKEAELQQVAMMMAMMMMGGILGPEFSQMAPMMMMGMQSQSAAKTS
ncbi:MAG: hypothetical protein WCU88_04035 [Elusimicrobiota bacterium]|jgi:hypothetical protein